MCGRLSIIYDARMGIRVTQVDERAMTDDEIKDFLQRRRYNVAPTQKLAVLHDKRLQVARWGLKDEQDRLVINTRIESRRAPLWRGIIGHSHAVVPATGYYEWKRLGATKEAQHITRSDGEPLMLAAVATTQEIDGAPMQCVSIVTCEPNATMAKIHDRMPVVLEADAVHEWLSPQEVGMKRIVELASPADEGVLRHHAVSPRVNDSRNDGEDLTRPAGRQGTLF